MLLEAVRAKSCVHFLGEGPLLEIAAYLAGAFHNGDGTRVLPARVLAECPTGPDRYLKAVEAFVRRGDVLFLMANSVTPRVERAAKTAKTRGARVLGLLGQQARGLVGYCEVAIVVPSSRP